ncbi:MAG: adenosylhomocysteinase [Oscillospiraceae bacterium]
MKTDIDLMLAPSGEQKINWATSYMPLLHSIRAQFEQTRPFAGMRIAMSIHLEAKTACLALTLRAGGAEVWVTGCNPLSTQDDVAAALVSRGFSVSARHGASAKEYESHLVEALSCRPHLMIDDGGDFTNLLHHECAHLASDLIGGCEETTTGIRRLRAREAQGCLAFPMISVNDADCKHLFDNRYGTGQSTMTAVMQTTNLSIASRTIVVAGYGWCGRGIAMRAHGMGARVIITEVNPVKAIEAAMDGFSVMTMDDAAPQGDVFITATGCHDVIIRRHLERMHDGAILCNSGHFDVEISKDDLEAVSTRIFERKPSITGYELPDGRILNLLAQGRLVNLAAGMGHPIEIMDMSFAIQARCLEFLAQEGASLKKALYPVPAVIDQAIASLKLASMGLSIDHLTPEQTRYLSACEG